jgi:hypothetical protein
MRLQDIFSRCDRTTCFWPRTWSLRKPLSLVHLDCPTSLKVHTVYSSRVASQFSFRASFSVRFPHLSPWSPLPAHWGHRRWHMMGFGAPEAKCGFMDRVLMTGYGKPETKERIGCWNYTIEHQVLVLRHDLGVWILHKVCAALLADSMNTPTDTCT